MRRIVRQTFVVCKNKLWDMEWVMEISLIFEELLLHPKTPVGYNLHLTDVYLEELAKVLKYIEIRKILFDNVFQSAI